MELQYKLILTWISFALTCGVLEAIYFNKVKRHVKIKGINIHNWFTVIRSIFAIPIVLTLMNDVWILEGWSISVLVGLLFSVIIILIFPFFHDGAYYTVRELLKKGTYPLYWIDNSEETDAKYSYSFTIRTIFFIIVLLIFPY